MKILKKMSLKNLTIGFIFFGMCLSFCDVVVANPVTIKIITLPGVGANFSKFVSSEWTVSGKLTPMEELRNYTQSIGPDSLGQIQVYQKPFDGSGYLSAITIYKLSRPGSKISIFTLFNGKGEIYQLSCFPQEFCAVIDKDTIKIR